MAVAGVSDEHATTVATIGVGIGIVAAAIAWFDARIEKRLKAHELAEFAKQDARDKLDAERHRGLLSEISHVKDLIDLKGEIKAMRRRMTNGDRQRGEPDGGLLEGG